MLSRDEIRLILRAWVMKDGNIKQILKKCCICVLTFNMGELYCRLVEVQSRVKAKISFEFKGFGYTYMFIFLLNDF